MSCHVVSFISCHVFSLTRVVDILSQGVVVRSASLSRSKRAVELTVFANLIAYGTAPASNAIALNATRDAFIAGHFELLTGKAATENYPASAEVSNVCAIRPSTGFLSIRLIRNDNLLNYSYNNTNYYYWNNNASQVPGRCERFTWPSSN